jgi:hypothetical protein
MAARGGRTNQVYFVDHSYAADPIHLHTWSCAALGIIQLHFHLRHVSKVSHEAIPMRLEGKYIVAGLCGRLSALLMGQAPGGEGRRQCSAATPRRGLVWAVSIAKAPLIASTDVICTEDGYSQMVGDPHCCHAALLPPLFGVPSEFDTMMHCCCPSLALLRLIRTPMPPTWVIRTV